MKKKFLKLFVFVISLFLLFDIWQMILKYDVQNVRDDYFDVVNDNKSDLYYGALLRFSYPSIKHRKVENLKLEIEYAYHNFTSGYIETRYSSDVYDLDDGGEKRQGSYRCFTKMYIEKRDGRWIVTRIEEEAGSGFHLFTEDMYYNSDGTVQERWK